MNAMNASANDCSIANDCTIISSLRLSLRSATRPAHAPRISTGPNWHAANSPRANPLSVSFSTSNAWAMRVSQLPIWEISWPPKNRRKLRTRSDSNVPTAGRWIVDGHRGSAIRAPRRASTSFASTSTASDSRWRSSSVSALSCEANHDVRRLREPRRVGRRRPA